MNLKSVFFSNSQKKKHIFYNHEDAALSLSNNISPLLPSIHTHSIIVFCIGTDRSTGDSLGPIIGSILHENMNTSPFNVYGTLEKPIHAVNLEEQLEKVNKNHENPFIIAIDACLGRVNDVGSLQVGKGAIKPGAAVRKELPSVGHIHIKGIVNVSGFMEFFVLQNTRLHIVMSMARTIAQGIEMTANQYSNGINYKQQLTFKRIKSNSE
ncbi:spore protease YyaC [Bacillus carboniphilus]|uniref:Spore protease YyaC n=1 Tax=Bacillus carboniphilus TaxID=86663 RepID=A0ABY9JST5_9BACI|nr:spore protease YyaC [Bacillus carboniphilus]WLR41879.1 spore protease YyaC [Bacillus carboniphilus]